MPAPAVVPARERFEDTGENAGGVVRLQQRRRGQAKAGPYPHNTAQAAESGTGRRQDMAGAFLHLPGVRQVGLAGVLARMWAALSSSRDSATPHHPTPPHASKHIHSPAPSA